MVPYIAHFDDGNYPVTKSATGRYIVPTEATHRGYESRTDVHLVSLGNGAGSTTWGDILGEHRIWDAEATASKYLNFYLDEEFRLNLKVVDEMGNYSDISSSVSNTMEIKIEASPGFYWTD